MYATITGCSKFLKLFYVFVSQRSVNFYTFIKPCTINHILKNIIEIAQFVCGTES